MKLHHVVLALLVILLGLGGWLLFCDGDDSAGSDGGRKPLSRPSAEQVEAPGPAVSAKPFAKPAAKSRAKPAAKPVAKPLARPMVVSDTDEFSPADRKVVDALQTALDADDLERVLAQVKEASASTNPAVRLRAVEALQWFGEKTVGDLILFLGDTDGDVRERAEAAFDLGVSQMDDERGKVRLIESVMSIEGACSKDLLTMLSGTLNGISDETLTVNAAVRVIEANRDPEAVAAMKDVYRFTTGDDYAGADGAKAWLAKKKAEAAEEQGDAHGEPDADR